MTKDDANFTCDASALRAAMRIAGWIAEPNKSAPILDHCRIDAFSGGVNVSVTDLDIYLSFRVDADGGRGKMLLPVRRLLGTLTGFQGPTTIAYAGGQVSGLNGGMRFRLPTVSPASFPAHPDEGETVASLTMNLDQFGWALQQCEPAISTEETRYYLNGIHLGFDRFDGRKSIRTVATDGHRMNICRLPEAKGDTLEKFDAIIPRKAVKTLIRLLLASDKNDSITVTQTTTRIAFKGPYWRLVSKMIDGTFPDYQRVIPTRRMLKTFATVNRASTLSALARVTSASADRLTVEAGPKSFTLAASGAGADLFEAVETEHKGPSVTFGVNPRYLRTALDLTEQRAEIGISDAYSALIIADPDERDFLQVVMPTAPQVAEAKALPAPEPAKPASKPSAKRAARAPAKKAA